MHRIGLVLFISIHYILSRIEKKFLNLKPKNKFLKYIYLFDGIKNIHWVQWQKSSIYYLCNVIPVTMLLISFHILVLIVYFEFMLISNKVHSRKKYRFFVLLLTSEHYCCYVLSVSLSLCLSLSLSLSQLLTGISVNPLLYLNRSYRH